LQQVSNEKKRAAEVADPILPTSKPTILFISNVHNNKRTAYETGYTSMTSSQENFQLWSFVNTDFSKLTKHVSKYESKGQFVPKKGRKLSKTRYFQPKMTTHSADERWYTQQFNI